MLRGGRQLEAGFDVAELARRLANVVRVGTVAAVDHTAWRLRARYDTDDAGRAILTAWIPWVVARAGTDRTWWAPEVDEQVVLLCPSGELTQAIALPALYRTHTPPRPHGWPPGDPTLRPRDPDHQVTEHGDGALFTYDRAQHRYTVRLPAAGRVEFAVGGHTLVLDASGLTHEGVNVGSTHTHGGVDAGPARTAGPG